MSTWDSNMRTRETGLYGPCPVDWFGTNAVDGDADFWLEAPLGSHYMQMDLTNDLFCPHVKLESNGRDDDWSGGGVRVLQERVAKSQFTDVTTTGTYQMKGTIPAGAFVLRWVALNVVDFSGDTTAAMDIGSGSGGDPDRFNTASDVSVFGTADYIDGGAPSGVQILTADLRPTIIVTSSADFTNVNTLAAATIRIYYLY